MNRSRYIILGELLALATLALTSSASAQRPSELAITSVSSAPLTLRSLLDALRSTHPAIQAAQARVRAAEGMRATAGRLGNPTLGYQVENTAFPAARSVVGIDRETMETATLPLEPIYLRGARVARTAAEVRVARAEADRERQRVALDATAAFYRVALARITVATGRDLVAWLDSLVAYNGARAREGVAAEADLLRSTLERDRAAAEATMAEAELAQASAQLAAFLDGPADGAFDVVAGDAPLSIPALRAQRVAMNDTLRATGNASLATGLSLRPDIRAARERVTAASATISTEQRMLFREAGVTLGAKQMMGTSSMVAGFSLPFPLFDQNRGEVVRATAERDVARYDLALAERQGTADIEGASAAARLLTDRAEALARPRANGLLVRADEMRRIALGAYREGAIPLVQVLDAARAWGDTRLTYYRTLYLQHQSVLALVVATGGDLFSTTLTPSTGTAR